MKKTNALIPSFIGTSLMTILSYSVSVSKSKNFKEPELLAALVSVLFAKQYKFLAIPSGWTMHYMMGFLMTVIFQERWRISNRKPTIKEGIYAGLIGGLAGIYIWKTIFKISANSPKTPVKSYFGHLLIAHAVFGIGVALTSRFVNPFKNRK